jgi:alanine racemase
VTHRAEATVDLSTFRRNLAYLCGPVCGGDDVARMLVVKADAYGHGAGPVAQVARSMGIPWLGVAYPSEALRLREAGDQGRILAWLFAPGDPDLVRAIDNDVDLGVGSVESLEAVAAAAQALGRRAKIHLKIDTGLGRGGCAPAAWEGLVGAAARIDTVDPLGVWSHLASADIPGAPETTEQVSTFEWALDTARSLGVIPQMRHLASSGAALATPSSRYDLVRLGMAAYGITPGPLIDAGDLRPIMTLRSTVAAVKRVPEGHGVSYNLTWRAPRATSLALVPIGYGDGIPRTAAAPQVLVSGSRADIVGRIAMDQVVVDVGDRDVCPGDEVVVWGPGDLGEPTALEWASWDNTIGYEIVTRLGPRVPRRYVGAG